MECKLKSESILLTPDWALTLRFKFIFKLNIGLVAQDRR